MLEEREWALSEDYHSEARTDKGPMIAPFIGIRVTYASRFTLSVRARSSAGCIFSLTGLPHGEIETIDRLGLPVRIVLQEQSGKLKPGKGVLGAETSTGRPCSQPPGAGPDFVSPTEEGVLSLR